MKWSIAALLSLLNALCYGQSKAETERWIADTYNAYAWLKSDPSSQRRSVRFEANYLIYQLDSIRDGQLVRREVSKVDLTRIDEFSVFNSKRFGRNNWDIGLDCAGKRGCIEVQKTFPQSGTAQAANIGALSLPLDESFSENHLPEKMRKAFETLVRSNEGNARSYIAD